MDGYTEKHNASGLKIGDTVTVTRRANSYEDGWEASWNPVSMNEMVGGIFKICSDRGDGSGFALKHPRSGDRFWFPYMVLKKLLIPIEPDK